MSRGIIPEGEGERERGGKGGEGKRASPIKSTDKWIKPKFEIGFGQMLLREYEEVAILSPYNP